jgi:hypothetical protein
MPPKNGTLKMIKWTVTIIVITGGAIASGYAIIDSLKTEIHKNTTQITRNADSNKTVHEKIESLEAKMEEGFGEIETKFEKESQGRQANDSTMLHMLIKINNKIDKFNGDSGR